MPRVWRDESEVAGAHRDHLVLRAFFLVCVLDYDFPFAFHAVIDLEEIVRVHPVSVIPEMLSDADIRLRVLELESVLFDVITLKVPELGFFRFVSVLFHEKLQRLHSSQILKCILHSVKVDFVLFGFMLVLQPLEFFSQVHSDTAFHNTIISYRGENVKSFRIIYINPR